MDVEIIELFVAYFELFKRIMPFSMLADSGRHTELLIIMDVNTEGAACRFGHPRWIDMGMEELMVVVVIFLL